MGNSFDTGMENSNQLPTQTANADYWANISRNAHTTPTFRPSAAVAPWLPSYTMIEPAPVTPPARPTEVFKPQENPVANQAPAANPFDLLQAAEASLAKNGMNADTKKIYESAISAADAMFSPGDLKPLQTLADVLSTGKKLDGSMLAPDERFKAHQILDAEMQAAQLGVQLRLVYSAALQQNRQFATAEATLKDAIKAADRMPQDLVKTASSLLQKDLANSTLSREQQIALGELQKDYTGDKSLKHPGFAYLPTLTRIEAASFYVSAQPRDANRTPNGVLKPEKAIAMLDEAKSTYQQNLGGDVSKKVPILFMMRCVPTRQACFQRT